MRQRQTVTGSFGDIKIRELRNRSCSSSSSWGAWSTIGSAGAGSVTTKTIRDTKTPRFQSLLRCGRFLPLNPLQVTTVTDTRIHGFVSVDQRVTSCSAVPLTRQVRGTALHWLTSGAYVSQLGPPEVPEAVMTAVTNAAVAQGREAVWDTLTFLGEWKETQSMLANCLHRITNIASRCAYAARKVKKNPAKAFSKYWLEYRYGWLPAVMDAQSALKALAHVETDMHFGRGYQAIEFDNEEEVLIEDVDSITDFRFQRRISGSHIVRGWSAVSVSDGIASQRFGFDPVTTAYELMTFSFILDWFIQIGTWLASVSWFQPGKTLGSCCSIKSEYTQVLTGMAEFHNSAGTTVVSSEDGPFGEWRLHTKQYQRFARAPSLPGWNPRISLPRIIDLVALCIGSRRQVRGILRH